MSVIVDTNSHLHLFNLMNIKNVYYQRQKGHFLFLNIPVKPQDKAFLQLLVKDPGEVWHSLHSHVTLLSPVLGATKITSIY